MQTIDTAELRELLSRGEIDEFWNVLTDEYYRGELIPGSRHVPLDRLGREAVDLAKGTSYVVYCSNEACPQSDFAAAKLLKLGFRDVRVYEGGLAAWKAAGLPTRRTTLHPVAA
jgi:rhodanese-related sulfurtransferase